MSDNYALYATMLLIRRFEERILEEFSTGRLFGTTHTCIGQEADAAGIFSVTDPQDVIFSNHRSHGHFLAYGGDPYQLVAELMGKATGLVGGRGGSQHLYWRNFYSNGIQGGITPVATGMALAEKARQTGRIVLVFIGDGTLGQGVLYESLNIASLWKLPVIYVLEDNRYAQTTPVELAVSGSMSGRFAAFEIPTWEVETTDVLEIRANASQAVEAVRRDVLPAGLILHTYRFAAHSKGDDVRDPAEIERCREHDPLLVHGARLGEAEKAQAEAEVASRLEAAFARAISDPFPSTESLTPPLSIISTSN